MAVIDPEAETRCIKAFVDINELNYFHSPDAMGIGLSEELVCKVLTG